MSAILMYHSIAAEPVNPFLQVAPSSLQRHLAILEDLGYSVIGLQELLDRCFAGAAGQKFVALTFDDGYADVAAAKPVLAELDAKPTLFICPAHAGGDHTWAGSAGFRAELLTVDEMRALRDEGWDIQCHGWEHVPLARMTEEEIDAQLVRCQAWFREQLDLTANVLAYPYGDANAMVAAVASRYFHFGLAVDAVSDISSRRFNIPRIVCVDHLSRSWLEEQLAMHDVGGAQ